MKNIKELIGIVKRLRSPDGCEWDKKQTHKTLVPYLLEETYEVIEAIENNNYESLKEELGDLLLHIVFQTELAEEKNKFSMKDSIDSINKKLIRRHPHVFDNKKNKSWGKGNWEFQKQKEKERESILEGVPISLPALLQARRIQEKAASVGFDWENNNQVLIKVDEEINELIEISKETGDRVWPLPNYAEFKDYLKSDTADIANCSEGRYGGTCTAAKFLEQFVDKTDFINIDISSVMKTKKTQGDQVTGMSGSGVRNIVELILSKVKRVPGQSKKS